MKYTVLYVDDEVENLRLFKTVFRREYKIFIAQSGEEGLRLLDENDCHLIISDQRMPGMTGVEFLKKVFERIPSIPPSRMILSGFSKTADIEEAKSKNYLYAFVSKPWDPTDLKREMDETIEKAINSA